MYQHSIGQRVPYATVPTLEHILEEVYLIYNVGDMGLDVVWALGIPRAQKVSQFFAPSPNEPCKCTEYTPVSGREDEK